MRSRCECGWRSWRYSRCMLTNVCWGVWSQLLDRCCRPEPAGCEDIGTWYPIMEIVSIIAVMTNMAAVIFSTSNPAFHVNNSLWMVWMFVMFEVRVGAAACMCAAASRARRGSSTPSSS